MLLFPLPSPQVSHPELRTSPFHSSSSLFLFPLHSSFFTIVGQSSGVAPLPSPQVSHPELRTFPLHSSSSLFLFTLPLPSSLFTLPSSHCWSVIRSCTSSLSSGQSSGVAYLPSPLFLFTLPLHSSSSLFPLHSSLFLFPLLGLSCLEDEMPPPGPVCFRGLTHESVWPE